MAAYGRRSAFLCRAGGAHLPEVRWVGRGAGRSGAGAGDGEEGANAQGGAWATRLPSVDG